MRGQISRPHNCIRKVLLYGISIPSAYCPTISKYVTEGQDCLRGGEYSKKVHLEDSTNRSISWLTYTRHHPRLCILYTAFP